uniref:Uncharacterized protein n=1 Tax=Babesia bovis TaxID=5865 RepID=A7ARQ7_BABBO|eukprot:XP_001610794.1 hypothetical protein [Babesia bovis T2Bo]
MAHPSDPPYDDQWETWDSYTRFNVSLCPSIRHLIYRLHTASNHKLKFALSMHIRTFEDDLIGSEQLRNRAIMALEPEFLALLLRSSTAIGSYGLLIIKCLLKDTSSARHLSSLVPYIVEFLSYQLETSDYDATTNAVINKVHITPQVFKTKVVSDCVCLLQCFNELLGPSMMNITIDPVELYESVDDLSKDLFDMFSDVEGSISTSGRCRLCHLEELREFKEASMLCDEQERDIDALAVAHLEEIDISIDSAGPSELPDQLIRCGESILSLLPQVNDTEHVTERNSLYINSLRNILILIPMEYQDTLVAKCLDSKNFDVLLMLIDICMGTDSISPGNRRNICSKAARLLELKLEKYLNNRLITFVTYMLETDGLSALCPEGYTDTDLVKQLCSIVRRAEIEIHIGIYDVCRQTDANTDFSASFQLLEALLVRVAESESMLPSCHDLFTCTHRIAGIVFDFFEDVASKNVPCYPELITCCYRFIGCWMTLEPMHLSSTYRKKLPKILSVITCRDFAWLLPSLEFIDSIELDSIDGLFYMYLGTMYICFQGNEAETSESQLSSSSAISMCHNLVQQMFLESSLDPAKLFASLGNKGDYKMAYKFANSAIILFMYSHIIDKGNVHFSPRLPLDLCLPLPAELSGSTAGKSGAKDAMSFLQSYFIAECYRLLPELDSSVSMMIRKLSGSSDQPASDTSQKEDPKSVHPEADSNDQSQQDSRTGEPSLPLCQKDIIIQLQKAIEASLSDRNTLCNDWSMELSDCTLAVASVCLCRLHQSDVRDLMDASVSFILMIKLTSIGLSTDTSHDLVMNGWISSDCASAGDFMSTLVSAIR